MFDIGNEVLDLYYIYFGDVCIKVVGQIELERVKKKIVVHKNPLDIYFFKYLSPV